MVLIVRCSAYALAVLPALVFPIGATAQPDEMIRSVEKAWKNKEASLNSIRLEWNQRTLIYKDGLTDWSGAKARDGAAIPRTNQTYDDSFILTLEGDKIRMERSGYIFDPLEEKLIPIKYTKVYDGKTGLYLEDQSRLPAPLNVGTREVSMPPERLRSNDLLPVLQAIRPTNRALAAIDLNQFQDSGRRVRINGKDCVELAMTIRGGKGAKSIWVDGSRDFAVLRSQSSYSSRASPFSAVKEETDYEEFAPGTYLPAQWTIINQGWSVPICLKTTARMERVQFSPKNPSTMFETRPPPGSLVDEIDDDKRRTYLIRYDGSSREVEPGGVSEAVGELLREAANPPRPWWRRHQFLLISAFAGLLIIGVTVFSRRRIRVVKPNDESV